MIFSNVEGKKTRTGRSLKVWFFSDWEQEANVAAFLELKKEWFKFFWQCKEEKRIGKGPDSSFSELSV